MIANFIRWIEHDLVLRFSRENILGSIPDEEENIYEKNNKDNKDKNKDTFEYL